MAPVHLRNESPPKEPCLLARALGVSCAHRAPWWRAARSPTVPCASRCSQSTIAMTFAGRYQLEETLLSTAVETFTAVDLTSSLRVLVHVFPAGEHGLGTADSPQRVIERFIQITGAPAVFVRGAGV